MAFTNSNHMKQVLKFTQEYMHCVCSVIKLEGRAPLTDSFRGC